MFKHPLDSPSAVVPFVDEGLGNSSYLVDLGDGSALVIDPVRDPSSYVAEAERRGLRIRFTVDTHLHADFVSGGRELAAAGAIFLAPAGARLAFDHQPIDDEDEIGLGGLILKSLATPGHTPEHLSYVLLDDGRPIAAFTGGALIVGSIARTDLVAADETIDLTRSAYRAVRSRLGVLPDDLPVYPTHGGGSFCSVAASGERTTTIGRERRTNPVLTETDEDTFVATFLAGLGTFPPYFLRTRAINQRGTALGGHRRKLTTLDARAVRDHMSGEGVVVDARPFEAYSAGHIPGSISIELRPQFATWLGWVVPEDVPLVFVLDETQDRADLIRQCLNIGYDDLAGELNGGISAWTNAGHDVAKFDLVHVGERRGALIDVRQGSELASGMIPGAKHAEAGEITPGGVPDGPLTLYCGHGQRASTAASLLERAGKHDVSVLMGGPPDWSAATGEPLERIA
jgi:glyoxylase-like metal-dependent hydrolase (beta-lactamase superfamily II)/rhodanese-related sulfurtransferase